MVKYLIDSDVDFPRSMKRTPIIDMTPSTTADMVNADCVHKRWLDALCPTHMQKFNVNGHVGQSVQKIEWKQLTDRQ